MLRNGFLPEEGGRGLLRKKRMAIFAVSLVLHAFLVYGLYHARLTVKVFPVRSAVRDVLLVPPVTLTLPEPIEKYIQNYPSSGGIFGLESDRGRPGPAEEKRSLPEGNAANRPGPGPGSGLAPENLMKNQPSAPPSSGPSLSGELALGSRYAEQEDGKLRINLSAIPDHVVEAPLGFENGKEGRRSFLRYVRPSRFGTGAGTGAGPRGAPRRRHGNGRRRPTGPRDVPVPRLRHLALGQKSDRPRPAQLEDPGRPEHPGKERGPDHRDHRKERDAFPPSKSPAA